MKNKKMNAASNNLNKQQSSRLSEERISDKSFGSKPSSTSTDGFQPKKAQQSKSSQQGAAVKSKSSK